MELRGQRCLVTGGAGFIGSHLVDALLEAGAQVSILDNFANGALANVRPHVDAGRLEVIRGSVTDPFITDRACRDADVVFHLACLGVRHSLTHPFENHQVNAEGTLQVLEAARRHAVRRFVYCSSSEVYGTATRVPMDEDHPTRPSTVYGASKLAGETYARAYHATYGFPAVVLRPFNTFGPRSHYEGDAGEFIPKSVVRLLNQEPVTLYGDGQQTRDYTFVTDTAAALVAAAACDAAVGETFNAGSGFEISVESLAKKLAELVGRNGALVHHSAARPGDVLRLCADARRFTGRTGWRPSVDLEAGLRATVDWFTHHQAGVENLMRDEADRSWERLYPR